MGSYAGNRVVQACVALRHWRHWCTRMQIPGNYGICFAALCSGNEPTLAGERQTRTTPVERLGRPTGVHISGPLSHDIVDKTAIITIALCGTTGHSNMTATVLLFAAFIPEFVFAVNMTQHCKLGWADKWLGQRAEFQKVYEHRLEQSYYGMPLCIDGSMLESTR